MKYSWLTMLWEFLLYNKVIQWYIYTHPFFFKFFSHIEFHRTLGSSSPLASHFHILPCAYVSPQVQFLEVTFQLQLLQNIGYIPCIAQYIIVACLTPKSWYLLILRPYIASPHPVTTNLSLCLWVCFFVFIFTSLFYFFKIPRINNIINICLSLSDLFHLAWCFPSPFMLLQMGNFVFVYSWIASHYLCIHPSSFIHPFVHGHLVLHMIQQVHSWV